MVTGALNPKMTTLSLVDFVFIVSKPEKEKLFMKKKALELIARYLIF